jgi:hypothetical protein
MLVLLAIQSYLSLLIRFILYTSIWFFLNTIPTIEFRNRQLLING